MAVEIIDVGIIGGGPAGLSAALWLGRCGRRVVIFDSGKPRNQASRALHGFLTRDGMPPLKLRKVAENELSAYPSVEFRRGEIRSARVIARGFELVPVEGSRLRCRLLLLATGRRDDVPPAPGFREFYGRGVYHCPYCDGWEHRGETLAVYNPDGSSEGMLEVLRTWSRDVVLCTDGRPAPRLSKHTPGRVITEKLIRLESDARGMLSKLCFEGDRTLACSAIFFCSNCVQQSDLPESLGCRLDGQGSVVCYAHAAKGVPRLYVAGNVRGGVHLAITAAAEGAEAALAMNERLLDEDLRLPRSKRTPYAPARPKPRQQKSRA